MSTSPGPSTSTFLVSGSNRVYIHAHVCEHRITTLVCGIPSHYGTFVSGSVAKRSKALVLGTTNPTTGIFWLVL